MMKKNIGQFDRFFRFTLAFILLGLAYWQESWILFLFSLFTFYESFVSWCFFYQLIGKNTCPIEKNTKNKSE